MTNRITSQATALALAMFVTVSMLSSMDLLADRAHQDTQAKWEAPTTAATQVVVISGKREPRS